MPISLTDEKIKTQREKFNQETLAICRKIPDFTPEDGENFATDTRLAVDFFKNAAFHFEKGNFETFAIHLRLAADYVTRADRGRNGSKEGK